MARAATPPWGIHTGEDRPSNAALIGEGSDPDDGPHIYGEGYRHGHEAGKSVGVLKGCVLGFVLALLVTVLGCTVFAALDREPVRVQQLGRQRDGA